jgi:hypothetical protein
VLDLDPVESFEGDGGAPGTGIDPPRAVQSGNECLQIHDGKEHPLRRAGSERTSTWKVLALQLPSCVGSVFRRRPPVRLN